MSRAVHEHTRHFTASAVVIDPERRLVLLVDHKAEGRRQFPGGHVDPDESGDQAAVREVFEETGVHATIWQPPSAPRPYGWALPVPLMVAEFPAPAKPHHGEPRHHHIDLMYVATADSSAPLLHQPAEVEAAVWLPIDTLDTATVRPDVPVATRAALAHLLIDQRGSVMAGQDDGLLVETLGLCGFEEVGRRTGAYVRMRWPDDQSTLVVPLDRDAPEYPEMMTAVNRELVRHIRRGSIAKNVVTVFDDLARATRAEPSAG